MIVTRLLLVAGFVGSVTASGYAAERRQVRCVIDPAAAALTKKAAAILPMGTRIDGTRVVILANENNSGRGWLGEAPIGGGAEGGESAAEAACREFGEEIVPRACGPVTIHIGAARIIDNDAFVLLPAKLDTSFVECLAAQPSRQMNKLRCDALKIDDGDPANTVCTHLWTTTRRKELVRTKFRFPAQQSAILQAVRAYFGL